jgi:hypothetical protein
MTGVLNIHSLKYSPRIFGHCSHCISAFNPTWWENPDLLCTVPYHRFVLSVHRSFPQPPLRFVSAHRSEPLVRLGGNSFSQSDNIRLFPLRSPPFCAMLYLFPVNLALDALCLNI